MLLRSYYSNIIVGPEPGIFGSIGRGIGRGLMRGGRFGLRAGRGLIRTGARGLNWVRSYRQFSRLPGYESLKALRNNFIKIPLAIGAVVAGGIAIHNSVEGNRLSREYRQVECCRIPIYVCDKSLLTKLFIL